MDIPPPKPHSHYLRTLIKGWWVFVVLAAIDAWDVIELLWNYPDKWKGLAAMPLLVIGFVVAIFMVYMELRRERNAYYSQLQEHCGAKAILRQLRELEREGASIRQTPPRPDRRDGARTRADVDCWKSKYCDWLSRVREILSDKCSEGESRQFDAIDKSKSAVDEKTFTDLKGPVAHLEQHLKNLRKIINERQHNRANTD